MDLEKIKEYYGSLEDYEIENLAKNESAKLEADVIPLLVDEVKRRSLSEEFLEYIQSNEPLSDEEFKELINLVTNLPCPECGKSNGPLVGNYLRTLKSYVIFTVYRKDPVICSEEYMNKALKQALISNACFGWFGAGLLQYPFIIYGSLIDRKKTKELTQKIIPNFILENYAFLRLHKNEPSKIVEYIDNWNTKKPNQASLL
tara:strand:- start:930 stop:1535 length:606 start_codon:yes stop_codon:yes gene_type:complete